MQAMVLERVGEKLTQLDWPIPEPGPGEILLKVQACAVCRTDLHVIEGDLKNPKLPLIPGHEIIGTVESLGQGVNNLSAGQIVGVPWLGGTCGHCYYCLAGKENLCNSAVFTGYQRHGGYAEYTVANSAYCFAIPSSYSHIQAAPLLCAGLIGWRSLKLAGKAKRLGFYGFGAAAHIIIQIALYQNKEVFAFTKLGDKNGQAFAKDLGAIWSGASDDAPPEELDAAIIFAPVGDLIPNALKAIRKGGIVVCAGIHMSDIPSFPYEILWGERTIQSVANLTYKDGEEFFELAPKVPVRTHVTTYALSEANKALDHLGSGKINGAAVLIPNNLYSKSV